MGAGAQRGRVEARAGNPLAPEEEEAAELLAQVEPQELAFTSAKATVATCALSGTIDALPLDPAGLDDATVISLLEQYAPGAAEQADLWLASVDPTAFPPPPIAKNECLDDYGCEYYPKCKYGFQPLVNHRCVVIDCGPSKCSWCPSWVPDLLKHLAIKAWCSYVCIQTGVSPAPTVAVGAGGISALGGHFIGPICMAP
jgi:hypothetical protein